MSIEARPKEGDANYEKATECVMGRAVAARTGAGVIFCLCVVGCGKVLGARQPTSGDAKSMTARSPDDSAGEHNNGSGWTAAC